MAECSSSSEQIKEIPQSAEAKRLLEKYFPLYVEYIQDTSNLIPLLFSKKIIGNMIMVVLKSHSKWTMLIDVPLEDALIAYEKVVQSATLGNKIQVPECKMAHISLRLEEIAAYTAATRGMLLSSSRSVLETRVKYLEHDCNKVRQQFRALIQADEVPKAASVVSVRSTSTAPERRETSSSFPESCISSTNNADMAQTCNSSSTTSLQINCSHPHFYLPEANQKKLVSELYKLRDCPNPVRTLLAQHKELFPKCCQEDNKVHHAFYNTLMQDLDYEIDAVTVENITQRERLYRNVVPYRLFFSVFSQSADQVSPTGQRCLVPQYVLYKLIYSDETLGHLSRDFLSGWTGGGGVINDLNIPDSLIVLSQLSNDSLAYIYKIYKAVTPGQLSVPQSVECVYCAVRAVHYSTHCLRFLSRESRLRCLANSQKCTQCGKRSSTVAVRHDGQPEVFCHTFNNHRENQFFCTNCVGKDNNHMKHMCNCPRRWQKFQQNQRGGDLYNFAADMSFIVQATKSWTDHDWETVFNGVHDYFESHPDATNYARYFNILAQRAKNFLTKEGRAPVPLKPKEPSKATKYG